MTAREFKDRYLFDPQHDLLAEGTYTRVFKATDTLLQRDICIKYFRKEMIAGSSLIKELNRANVFFHPNICAFYDLIEIEETNLLGEVEQQPIGIIEYMNGDTIVAYLQKHKEDSGIAKKLFKDVIKGLSYLHSIGKPHLDLKPGNILVRLSANEPVAKITDFLNTENLHTTAVPASIKPLTLSYKAPEYFQNTIAQQTVKADIWSFGLIMYQVFANENLFYKEGDTVEKVIRTICHGDYWAGVHTLPEPFLSIVKRCLIRDVNERNISLEELSLMLDGLGVETIKTPLIEEPTKMEENEVPISVSPSAIATPPPLTIEPTPSPKPEKLGLSIPIILAALVILIGISAFIWTMIEHRQPTHATSIIGNFKNDTLAPLASTSPVEKRTIDTITQVVHDTVKVVQVLQTVVKPSFVPPAKSERIPEGNQINTQQANAHVLPTLPIFESLSIDRPYYFDLKTPLLSDIEFELFSENAAITALGKNTFYVKPLKSGALNIMVLDKLTHGKIAEKVYLVKAKSIPKATLGDDIIGGFVSPKLLLAKLTLQARSENGNYKVKSFRMTCKSGSCDINDVSNDGNFNESMIRFLHNVKAGEKLYFENIVAEDESGQPMKLDDIQVTTY